MSRQARKPRKTRAPSSPVAIIHYRDPDDGNERSVCNAEERAGFCGDTVVCSTDIREVTCQSCLLRAPYKAYHEDDADSYKQIRQFPGEWIDLNRRFKPGDKILWLRSDGVSVPDPDGEPLDLGFQHKKLDDKRYSHGNRKGMLGTITEVRDGKRYFWPPRYVESGGEGNWIAESRGWLAVNFPGGNRYDQDGNLDGTIAVHPDEEGSVWEKAK